MDLPEESAATEEIITQIIPGWITNWMESMRAMLACGAANRMHEHAVCHSAVGCGRINLVRRLGVDIRVVEKYLTRRGESMSIIC